MRAAIRRVVESMAPRARRRVAVVAAAAALFAVVSPHGARPRAAAAQTDVRAAASLAIAGGTFEASGVAAVPGGDGVLFVDDNTTDSVYWMRFDGEGKQVGQVTRVPLGVQVTDPEGITTDGARFYVVGSQSKEGGGAGLVRFSFDPQTRKVSGLERVDGLESLLLERVPGLKKLAGAKGINVEGLAWDPRRGRLLLGLRAPLAGGDAVVVPLELVDRDRPLAADNLRVGAEGMIRLALGGKAIRGMEAVSPEGEIAIVAGATDTAKRTEFSLWTWAGEPSAKPRRTTTIDRELKPEGVARLDGPGAGVTIVVCDVSRYVALAAPGRTSRESR